MLDDTYWQAQWLIDWLEEYRQRTVMTELEEATLDFLLENQRNRWVG